MRASSLSICGMAATPDVSSCCGGQTTHVPRSADLTSMVYVLPVPVWPYAKIVQLKPSSTASTILYTPCAYSRS